MIPIKKVEELILRHKSLEGELSSGNIDKKLFATKSKEYSDLNEIINQAQKYLNFEKNKKDLEKLIEDTNSDKEIKEIARIELDQLIKDNELNEKKIKLFLLPKDDADSKNAIIEIRAGTGGLEASLFASDLFKMYEKVSHKKKWNLEVISISKSEAGGLKEVIANIKGKNIYSLLKYESGVHRVQRVPKTESQGRIHTSTATVAVLPKSEEIDIEIKDDDIRTDVFHSGGAGGQNVNKVATAIRLTHNPSGIVVACQNERSQLQNKVQAMEILKSKLWDLELKKQHDEISKTRKSQVGSGGRSEKVRTYNYPQSRITDHRINVTVHNLSEFMDGLIDELIEPLMKNEQAQKMLSQNAAQ